MVNSHLKTIMTHSSISCRGKLIVFVICAKWMVFHYVINWWYYKPVGSGKDMLKQNLKKPHYKEFPFLHVISVIFEKKCKVSRVSDCKINKNHVSCFYGCHCFIDDMFECYFSFRHLSTSDSLASKILCFLLSCFGS